MERALVPMLPNSTTLILAGSWNRNPGDSRMNSTTATMMGPQSVVTISLSKVAVTKVLWVGFSLLVVVPGEAISANGMPSLGRKQPKGGSGKRERRVIRAALLVRSDG